MESRKPKKRTGGAEGDGDEEDVDPTAYFDQRVKELTEMRLAGKHRHLYPHKFHASMSVPQFQLEFSQPDIAAGVRLEREVSVAGRVYSKRSSGSSLYFYDLQAQGGRVQVVADRKTDKDDWTIHDHIKRGHHSSTPTHPHHHITTPTHSVQHTAWLSLMTPMSFTCLNPAVDFSSYLHCLRRLSHSHHTHLDGDTSTAAATLGPALALPHPPLLPSPPLDDAFNNYP